MAIGDLNQERGKLAEANIAKQLKDKHGKGRFVLIFLSIYDHSFIPVRDKGG